MRSIIKQDGFTALELISAIVISIIIIGIIYKVGFYAFQMTQNMQKRWIRETETHFFSRRFVNDVIGATEIIINEQEEVFIHRISQDTVVYMQRDSVIFRNDLPAHSIDLSCRDFSITPEITSGSDAAVSFIACRIRLGDTSRLIEIRLGFGLRNQLCTMINRLE